MVSNGNPPQTLEDVGVAVKDAVVLLDREQNGKTYIAAKGITMHRCL